MMEAKFDHLRAGQNAVTWISILGSILVLMSSCSTIGPGTIYTDRVDYSEAIANSWKQQVLLNIVKLRYVDTPVFLDVASIVSGYTVENTLAASVLGIFQFPPVPNVPAVYGSTLSPGLSGQTKYTDRPTITYTPLTGPDFVKSLMTPMPPASVLFLLQSGYPADFVLGLMLDSINGLDNRRGAGVRARPADPEFRRVLELILKAQQAGAVEINVRRLKDDREATLLVFRKRPLGPEEAAEAEEIRRLLKLDPEATEFTAVYGGLSDSDKQIAMLSRSMFHIMIELASLVDVPDRHRDEHRAAPVIADNLPEQQRLMRIRNAGQKPDDAFVAVPYRGHWFYIDDRDLSSKRTFTFMMLLFTLASQGEKARLPVITIPAG
jgi:hypothetical protein